MSTQEPATTPAAVRTAAALAGLPLEDARAEVVAEVLNGWLPGAYALNARMQAADLDQIIPITPFAAPEAKGVDDE